MSTDKTFTDKNSDQKVVSVLLNNGPTQAGVMVGIVNAISQPFSQPTVLKAINLSDRADSLPLFIAFVVSFLLAIYQTLVMQKTRISESLIVIPLVTGILFGMSLGANHLTADVMSSPTAANSNQTKDESEEQRIQLIKQLNELQKQVALLDNTVSTTQTNSASKTRGLPELVVLQATSKTNQANNTKTTSDRNLIKKQELKQQIEELRKKMQAMEEQRKKPKTRNLYRAW